MKKEQKNKKPLDVKKLVTTIVLWTLGATCVLMILLWDYMFPVLATICRQNDDNLLTQENIREEKIIEDNLIKDNDLTRLNEIKANPVAKELTKKLISCGYISISDLQLRDYINYFESLLDEGKGLVDIKVKLDYFIKTICHLRITDELDYQGKPIFKPTYTDDRKIQDRFIYFYTSLDKAFDRDIANDDLATSEVVNGEEEISDDGLPF